MDSPVQTAQAGLVFFSLHFLLNLGKSVLVHLEVNIKTLSLVFPPLDCPGHREEPVALRWFHKMCFLISNFILMSQSHIHPGTSDRILSDTFGVKYLNCFIVGIYPTDKIKIE